jgi:hypothetical protein
LQSGRHKQVHAGVHRRESQLQVPRHECRVQANMMQLGVPVFRRWCAFSLRAHARALGIRWVHWCRQRDRVATAALRFADGSVRRCCTRVGCRLSPAGAVRVCEHRSAGDKLQTRVESASPRNEAVVWGAGSVLQALYVSASTEVPVTSYRREWKARVPATTLCGECLRREGRPRLCAGGERCSKVALGHSEP